MTAEKTPDEQPKGDTARRVVTQKRQYFFPSTGASYESSSLESASRRHQKDFPDLGQPGDEEQTSDNEEVGDGE